MAEVRRASQVQARASRLAALLLAIVLLGGCSPQALLVRGVADQLAVQGSEPDNDLVLVRESSAFYLKLSESVLRRTPGHLPLAESLAAGFTQYAYAFVESEADRIQTTDARAAQRLRQRAAKLYARGHRHAMNALEIQHPGFAKALASADPALRLRDDEVGVAYWAAASWGAFIALSKDRPDLVADLPQAIQLAGLAWERQPGHGDGALASLMGSFEMARPGGTPQQAAAYFDRAIAAAGGRSAGPFVAKAETLAQPAGDRPAFEALLRQALAAAAARTDLSNEVMRQRAQWLLDTADDRF
jgi:predicted anti-sigma-YlaC factor YlaD